MHGCARDSILGVEIGGTKLQLAVGSPDGDLLLSKKGAAPTERGAPGILEWFAAEIPVMIEQAEQEGYRVRAVGVGFGGPVDAAAGKVLVSHQVSGWEDVRLRDWFEARFGLPVCVANDSNAAGWGEYCRGAGRGTRHFFYTNIGSGIGGALIIDGRLYDGQGFGAGEMGHTYIPDWTANTPGAAGKVENLCSGWSIERRLRNASHIAPDSPLGRFCSGRPETITCSMVGEAARLGDAAALEEIERTAQGVGLAIANVIALFHPERVAVGGGVALLGDVLFEPLRRHVERLVFKPYRNRYSIVPCELGETVVLVGAILLAAERYG